MALEWLRRENGLKDHQLFDQSHYGTEAPSVIYEERPVIDDKGQPVGGLFAGIWRRIRQKLVEISERRRQPCEIKTRTAQPLFPRRFGGRVDPLLSKPIQHECVDGRLDPMVRIIGTGIHT